MSKEFLKRAILLPACITLVLAIALFVFLKANIDNYIPVFNNTHYAYHDEVNKSIKFEKQKNANASSFKKNQCIGAVRAGAGYPIRYDMDYSNLQTSFSYLKQSVPFGETGFTYLKASSVNAKEMKKTKEFVIGSVFGEKKYRFRNEKSFNSEYKALTYAPDLSSAVIVYYQDSNGVGLASKYKALVYEEVK